MCYNLFNNIYKNIVGINHKQKLHPISCTLSKCNSLSLLYALPKKKKFFYLFQCRTIRSLIKSSLPFKVCPKTLYVISCINPKNVLTSCMICSKMPIPSLV